MTVEQIVRALLKEDPQVLSPDRSEFVKLVEVALRRAHWKTPRRTVDAALLDAVEYELERLIVTRPAMPKRADAALEIAG